MGRYIALALIIGLGASLFMGLVISRQDMVTTGQHFMDQQNMFDLRMISNYGWTDEYVEKFAELPGVEDAEGLLYLDLIARTGEMTEDKVYRFYSMPDRMNLVALRSGRMPQSDQECLVDGFFTDDSILGQTVTVSTLNDEDSLDALRYQTFTVVGRIASPLYLDMNRGTTAVGSGSLDKYFYLPANAFDADYYAEINLTMSEKFDIYTDAYHDYLEDAMDLMEPEAEKLSQQRFEEIKKEAEEKYQDGYQEYQDGLKEFRKEKADAEKKLADAYQELTDGEKELEEGRKKLIDAENQINSGRKQLDEAHAELQAQIDAYGIDLDALEASLPLIEAAVAAVENSAGMSGDEILGAFSDASSAADAAAELVAAAKKALEEAQAENLDQELIESLVNQLQNAEGNYASAQETLEAIMPIYNEYIAAIDSAEDLQSSITSLLGMLQQLATARDTINEQYRELDNAEEKLWIGWGEWGIARDKLAEGRIEYEDGLAEFNKEIAEAEAELKDAEEELKDARKQIDDMTKPDLIMLSRTSNVGYSNLESSSSIVAGVARILPVFFLLVASLVCITTMTRMIDEERTQIGTLKALGYTNIEIMQKYLVYSGSSAVIGCSLGLFLGCTLFPMIIWEAYKIMLYVQPTMLLTVNIPICAAIILVYTALMLSVTWYSCKKTLEEEPAQLIRPKAPDPGKKILLEYLPI